MNETIDLRASRMPLAFLCPGSIRIPELRVNERSEAADMGTACHAAMRPVVEGLGVQWDALPADDEMRMLVAMGAQLWERVAESFPAAFTEVSMSIELPPHALTGTADVVSFAGDTARILDWKFGRKDSDYREQMRAYCGLVLERNPSLGAATATIAWVREQSIESLTMTRGDVDGWWQDIQQIVVFWDGTHHPGPQCTYCPRGHECPARSVLVKRSIADVLGADMPAGLAQMTAEQIVDLHRKVALMTRSAKAVHDAIKTHVQEHGPVCADGMRLAIERTAKRRLKTLEAFPVLTAVLDDAQMADCTTISISKVESAVAKVAGRGKGKAAIAVLRDQLDEAGAVVTNEVETLTLTRDQTCTTTR